VKDSFPNTLSWDVYFKASELDSESNVNMAHPTFFSRLDISGQFTKQEIVAYLHWQVVHVMAPYLPKSFVNENFSFFNKRLQGQKKLASRKVINVEMLSVCLTINK
jgi:putative endopeptidase